LVLQRLLAFPYQLAVILLFPLLSAVWGIGCYFASRLSGGEHRAHRYMVYFAKMSLRLARLQASVAGLERLDLNRTYVFMPNHSSFLDILLIFASVPHDFRFIVKEEFFSIPLLGLTVKSSGQIPLNRKHPRKGLQSLKRAAERLKRDVSVVVFPEGTRSRDGKIHEFKTTLFVLPIRARAPVVPVLIEGAFESLPRGSLLLKRYPMKVTFLDPIPAESFSDKDRALYAETVRESLERAARRSTHGALIGNAEKATGAFRSASSRFFGLI
jgi:1-acyl-sn-glycerol-3-phosphate acyltransferase